MPNNENIQRVINQLIVEPDGRIEMMNFWSYRNATQVDDKDVYIRCDYREFERFSRHRECNTAACLAGWIVHLWQRPGADPLRLVQEIFDIPMPMVLALCYSENWYHFPAYVELCRTNAECSEREALIALLTKLKDGDLVMENRQLFDGSLDGVPQ